MAIRAVEFVDLFLSRAVRESEQMLFSQDNLEVDGLVRRCIEMAAEQNISQADIEADFPNLAEHFRFMIDIKNAGGKGSALTKP